MVLFLGPSAVAEDETEATEALLRWLDGIEGEMFEEDELLAGEVEELPGFTNPALFDLHLHLEVVAGYSDNPLRSSSEREGSGYQEASADALIWVPVGARNTFTGFVYGQWRYYNRSDMGVRDESLVLGQLRWDYAIEEHLVGLQVNGLAGSQIYEAFRFSAVSPAAGLIRQKEMSVLAHAEWWILDNWLWRMDAGPGWTRFGDERDDYDFVSGRWTTEYFPTENWELRTRYRQGLERYREKLERRPGGLVLPGSLLRLERYEAEVGVRRLLTQLNLRAGLAVRATFYRDGGGGYYDENRYSVVPTLEWRQGLWEVELEYEHATQDYRRRTVSRADTRRQLQYRSDIRLKVIRSIGDWGELFVEWESTDLRSRDTSLEYHENRGSLGWGRSF